MPERAAVTLRDCPHGDPTCPCPDGDPCHYEGKAAMRCPNRPFEPRTEDYTLDSGKVIPVRFEQHCHVEGCRWENETCGLSKLGVPARPSWPEGEQVPVMSIEWACGAARTTAAMEMEGLWDA